ncbi:MAG: hypothetical protein IPM57_01615 [Oligoflexia bacterium]|nr:hypothetical protein [Oligoflexia bacterium]
MQVGTVYPHFDEFLESRLNIYGHSLKEPQKLAKAILKLSDHFIRGVHQEDYWKDSSHMAAYISYFAILNFERLQSVFKEARLQRFLINASVIGDWGSGLGSALWAMQTQCARVFINREPKIFTYDKSGEALKEQRHWLNFFKLNAKGIEVTQNSLSVLDHSVDTLVMSYVLNEYTQYPVIPEHVQRLILVEPSTNQAGRNLLKFRDTLIEKNWFAWAPCTHQEFCPLYNQSGKDWCHHRVNWQKPDWFYELENHLPMGNDTLTLSYILMSKEKPIVDLSGITRVIGDEQPERGKTRQAICRGMNREFLSWLDRNRLKPGLRRGDLIRIKDAIQKPKELRISFMTDFEVIKLDD